MRAVKAVEQSRCLAIESKSAPSCVRVCQHRHDPVSLQLARRETGISRQQVAADKRAISRAGQQPSLAPDHGAKISLAVGVHAPSLPRANYAG